MWQQTQQEEYKLLQGKIDKIGEFRIKIKEWSVTIVLAYILGTKALQSPEIYLLILLPVILMFWLLEDRQLGIQSVFAKRVLELEDIIRRSNEITASAEAAAGGAADATEDRKKLWTFSPRIARMIMKARDYRPRGTGIWVSCRKAWAWLVANAERFFFPALAVIVVLLFVIRMFLSEPAPEALKGKA